jgi:type VI secretion system protein ImpE
MSPKELFQSGNLKDAIQALGAILRDNPADAKSRTFLFELLCFTGDYDRAEKHLNILAGENGQAEMGAVLYLSAIHAARERETMFEKRTFPTEPVAPSLKGTINGQPFESVEDTDPRLGARLELFAAGAYLWIPFIHIESIEIEAPKRLRDTLWAPAIVKTGESFKGQELGEVLLPVISPGSCKHADGNVALGRATEWIEQQDGEAYPVGLKMLSVDGEDLPYLEIRKLEFAIEHAAEAATE